MKNIFTSTLILISSFLLSQQIGTATYYADKYHNKKTASSKLYNMYKYTCASSSKYKLGTKLEITNLLNNKSVIVEVNDRGKGITGNKIDLSKQAFKEIADLKQGIVKILIKVLQE